MTELGVWWRSSLLGHALITTWCGLSQLSARLPGQSVEQAFSLGAGPYGWYWLPLSVGLVLLLHLGVCARYAQRYYSLGAALRVGLLAGAVVPLGWLVVGLALGASWAEVLAGLLTDPFWWWQALWSLSLGAALALAHWFFYRRVAFQQHVRGAW